MPSHVPPECRRAWEQGSETPYFPHRLESPIPVLIEKAHLNGGTNRTTLLRNAVRESATHGCDLLIVLDIAVEYRTNTLFHETREH